MAPGDIAARLRIAVGCVLVAACGRSLGPDANGTTDGSANVGPTDAPPVDGGLDASDALRPRPGATPVDGGGVDGAPDASLASCLKTDRPVAFVTTKLVRGDESADAGPSGFDEVCNQLAHAAKIPGTFVAYVSDGTNPPWFTLAVKQSVGWALPDGTNLYKESDRPPTPPATPLDMTERCTRVDDDLGAWTGAVIGGALRKTCGVWRASNDEGSYGNPKSKAAAWEASASSACTTQRHLYCFEARN